MERAPGVELAGYLSSAVGVGEAARRYVEALRSAGVQVCARDIPLPGRDRVRDDVLGGPVPSPETIAFNLLCLNPEQLGPYLEGPDAPPAVGRIAIGIWSWEVDVLPVGWTSASEPLAEIWTYSRFAATSIGGAVGVPVLGFPPPLTARAVRESSHALVASDRLDGWLSKLPSGFRVLVMFDYLSTLERKNPLGAIEAYKCAFGPEEGATLVLKSLNGRHRNERRAEVEAAAAQRPDIVLVDQTLSAGDRDALLDACDCYLSLHRSEGHGLPLAEAMARGKPVVATAYGGNVEFMSEANSYLVDWEPTRVGAGVEHYPAAASWAEPDIAHAARLMRAIRDNPSEAARRARRGREDVCALLAPSAVGKQMRRRLEELPGARAGAALRLARRARGRWHAARRS